MANSKDSNQTEGSHIDRAIEVSADELARLGPDALKALKEKYGLEVQIRSSVAGVDEIASKLGMEMPLHVAEFDRGFDRTTPGYDRFYDRYKSMINPGDLVTNPTIQLGVLVNELINRARG